MEVCLVWLMLITVFSVWAIPVVRYGCSGTISLQPLNISLIPISGRGHHPRLYLSLFEIPDRKKLLTRPFSGAYFSIEEDGLGKKSGALMSGKCSQAFLTRAYVRLGWNDQRDVEHNFDLSYFGNLVILAHKCQLLRHGGKSIRRVV